ncbi:alpha/beta fold hydrolase [Bhargavaea beijingensis]|uniref:alpha/beta fold hydrolase n=1 Tax=Bhargavaea beijingensis TaxID=426756 RepID=UPI0021ADC02B|nr:alpha/beta hydrolase [Bhargavaea beijingensis]
MKARSWIRRFVDTARGTFEFFEFGEGPPLAVTHLYSEFDERGHTFAAPFSEHYHVYLINLRGAGNSCHAEDPEEYSMDASVLDLEAIRKALGCRSWSFAGHSTGGMLALKYAIAAPDSLEKIIAGGTAASYEYCMDPDSIYCKENLHFSRIVEIMDLLNDPATNTEKRRALSFEWALMSYHSEEKLLQAMKKINSGKTVGQRLDYFRQHDCARFDVRKELRSVQTPAFIYCGNYDAQCPPKFGKEVANLLPNASFTLFNYSNHHPYDEEEEAFRRFVEMTI